MTDDYKKGLVTGLAMQPLYVTEGGADGSGGLCADAVIPAVLTEDGYCREITTWEG